MILKSLILSAGAAALLAAAPAWAQNQIPGGRGTPQGGGSAAESPGSGGLPKRDIAFIEHAAQDGRAEVELGRLAEQRASSPDVKAFGRRLVEDHGKANRQLMTIAQSADVAPPKGLDKEQRALHARLEKLSGPAFDRAFIASQVEDHTKDIRYFGQEAKKLENPQLQNFAQQTMPVLEQHLRLAEQLNGQLQGAAGSGGGSQQPAR